MVEGRQAQKYSRRFVIRKTGELAATGIILAKLGNGGTGKAAPESLAYQPQLYTLTVPGVSSDIVDHTSDPITSENFSWTKNEILFGPQAGFQKLREGGTVSVYIDPKLSKQLTSEVFVSWNKLGEELRGKGYFTLTTDLATADIRFLTSPENTTWVKVGNDPKVDLAKPFNSVTIYSSTGGNGSDPINNISGAHELGHAAFGFVDWLTPQEYKDWKEGRIARPYVNPQNGGDSQKPYRGVMNYVYWEKPNMWFGEDDRKLLKLGGYA